MGKHLPVSHSAGERVPLNLAVIFTCIGTSISRGSVRWIVQWLMCVKLPTRVPSFRTLPSKVVFVLFNSPPLKEKP